MKGRNRTNLNAYLFTNLVVVGMLLIGLWNRKPVWDVSIRFPNLLLILVILNTILIFREVILVAGAADKAPAKSRQKRARKKSRNLNELRTILKNSPTIDETTLNQSITRLQEISACEIVALYIIENNQCRLLSSAGEIPPALNGSRFILKSDLLSIKFSGNLGEEEIGKISSSSRPLSFKSAATRLELTALPLALKGNKTGLCVFSSKEAHKTPPISLASTALFLETLLALIESEKEGGDARYKDKTTDLLRFSCFASSFETEVERSERYKQEMTLLTLRINGYNEHSDLEKQQISKSAALSLRQSLRRLDLMFCDEHEGSFLAILTETGVAVSDVVARRIQKAFAKLVEKFDFISKHDLKIIIGGATYPTDATHGQGLLEKSRESLLEAGKENDYFKSYSNAAKPATKES